MKKTFILDTNVLIHDPESIFNFGDNIVVLPLAVIEELDRLKQLPDERGRNARVTARKLDGLRSRGKLARGVELESGGVVRIETRVKAQVPTSLVKKADNEILSVALGLKDKGSNVIFISKDINMRVKAEVLGLEVQDFEKAKVRFEELYSGWRELVMEEKLVEEFRNQKQMPAPSDMISGEYVLVKSDSDPNKTALGRFSPKNSVIEKIIHDKDRPWGLSPLNLEQRFALDALLREDIRLVTLVGIAGTGKTLLALACGLQLTFDESKFRRILISRPVVPMGRDIGYLPGSKEEKLSNWMGAFYDNLEFLVDTSGVTVERAGSSSSGKKLKPPEMVDLLFDTGKIELEALTYLRGRSIPSQYMIIDEAQNLTPLEVKTIVSRAGKDTKVVLTGDPYQIDSPYLDSSSNGLTYIAERFKGQELFAHITLTVSERSELAGLAADLL